MLSSQEGGDDLGSQLFLAPSELGASQAPQQLSTLGGQGFQLETLRLSGKGAGVRVDHLFFCWSLLMACHGTQTKLG